MKLIKEFVEFLKEYKVIGLAVAFVIGFASTALIKSFVDNMLMPVITGFVTNSWRTAVLSLGPVKLGWGAFLAELINFLIIAFLVFIVVKKVMALGEQKKGKKK